MSTFGLTKALTAELARGVEDLYARLDGELRLLGVACRSCGDCCDLQRHDHVLYASSLEIAYVRELHRLPLGGTSPLCPFWRHRRCAERDRRPLGCRTYFCDVAAREALHSLYEKYHAELRRLAETHRYPWRYTRFVDALRSGNGDGGEG